MTSTTCALDEEIAATKKYLEHLEARRTVKRDRDGEADSEATAYNSFGLNRDDIERFSRQMLCEELGASGTEKLRRAKVLVVGAGGLGSTVCLYLAAAGIGHISIVDFDVVERSNLHRQVIHNEYRIDLPKAWSAKLSCMALNPNASIDAVLERFDVNNAEALARAHDVIVDASDNVAARYLINDAAVLCRKPLVSGSAMRWEGQLTVYHHGPGTPCYRCVFPKAPPANVVGSCNDSGVVGPVPGTVGCLQALEVVKLLGGCGELLAGRMLLWNGRLATFKTIKLRPQSSGCEVCGNSPAIVSPLSEIHRDEYVVTACTRPEAALPETARATPSELHAAVENMSDSASRVVVVDVRDTVQYDMCHLSQSISIPLLSFRGLSCDEQWAILSDRVHSVLTPAVSESRDDVTVFVVCRRGLASSEAVRLWLLAQESKEAKPVGSSPPQCPLRIRNVDGGLNRYAMEANKRFPFY